MSKYYIGQKVVNVNSQEKGVIIDVLPGGRGRQLYRVRYGTEDKDSLETNLIPDADLSDPYECCKQGLFGSYLDFSRINTTLKINNTSNNTISSLKASKTIFKAYQFKPLLKFLNSSNRRLLIADEVGLGKTIEAGHIMMELAARKELRNVLIICPKMLQEKWKNELKEKFNFFFKIYDRKKDLVSELVSGAVRGIVNYESIRSSGQEEEESNIIIKYVVENNIKFDLILCDEAHRLRNSGTKTYKGAEIIIPRSTSTLFLTATPIMISEENLYNLLYLLDNQQFNNKEIFQTYLSINRPFITAITALNNKVKLNEIADNLKNTVLHTHYEENAKNVIVDELFLDVPLYRKIIENLTSIPDTSANRVQLQFDISSMSMMNNIFSRTRKREVTTDWSQPEREPRPLKIDLYSHEREQFDNVINEYNEDHGYVDEYGDSRLTQGHALGLIQKKRRIASSVYAYLNDDLLLNAGTDEFEMYPDAKFDKLIEVIKEVVDKNKKKIIVFALFKKTLKYLAIRLEKRGYYPVTIHGDVEDRGEIINKFKTSTEVNILLSSEVGSEGLDFQFCDALVNYDLPWNPMVVEQRIGRIDRFGQKSQKVNIYNLIVRNSIQEDIFDRLLNRIGIFKNCIGDLEAILDKETESGTLQQRWVKLEKELYCTELTPDERNRKIEDISKAMLFEKENIEQINAGLTDTLTNDSYFRNEIEKILKNYRYITEQELHNFLQALIRNYLTECTLKKHAENVYIFSLPLSNKSCLTNFLTRYQPVSENPDNDILFRNVINSLRNVNTFQITFNQETAYDNPGLEYVNSYHPIIVAAKEYFSHQYKDTIAAFQFGINIKHFHDLPQVKAGDYMLGIYTIYIAKRWFGKEQVSELMIPVVFDLQSQSIIYDDALAERFMGESQLFATAVQNPVQLDQNSIDIVRVEMASQIDALYSSIIEDRKMRLETSKILQVQRTEEFYDNRISNLTQTLSELENKAQYSISEDERTKVQRVLPAQRGLLRSLLAEKDEALLKINNSIILAKEPKLISLSQIKVY